jgi:putative peptidoglycan lipid II flippase
MDSPRTEVKSRIPRMGRGILTVGGFTLISRVTGFARDILMAAVLGAGPVADAFLVAFRLPNHFRVIFAEGAFNAAFVPAYARVREQDGTQTARAFADRIFTLLLSSQLVLLAVALAFTPAVLRVLAPGFDKDPERYGLAIELTRITFPYLMMMTLVTLLSGILNALNRFAAAAAAPILLNLTMMAALALAALFSTAGHAAAWGVLVAGVLEVGLVAANLAWCDRLPSLRWPTWDADLKRFAGALGPAVIGSAGVQLAVFADTIIATFLPAGALSALYYADRLNQLPGGVISIAVGTVLLPEMSRRIAAGDEQGARNAQSRAIELGILLTIPCMVAFLIIPDLILRVLFVRGAFTAADAVAAAATLAAYAYGLLPFVLIRNVIATFLARGDTMTPLKAALIAAAVNIAFKLVLTGPLAQVGLALATTIGAWTNFALAVWFAVRQGRMGLDRRMRASLLALGVAGIALAAAVFFAKTPVLAFFAPHGWLGLFGALITLAAIGGVVYGVAALALFRIARAVPAASG